VEHHPQPTAIAIIGCDTVVGRSLSVLLESHGYKTTLLDSYPTGVVDELLEGANLLILTPRVDQGVREAFLGAMGKRKPQKADMPVIALSTTTATEENLPEKEGVISVPWPSEIKVLVDRIEAALVDVPASSSSTTVLLPPGYSLERSDADVLVLRCPNGTVVAPFSARGAATEAIEREARTHYRERNRSA
jgi:DNA-binding response OmpR family regulator